MPTRGNRATKHAARCYLAICPDLFWLAEPMKRLRPVTAMALGTVALAAVLADLTRVDADAGDFTVPPPTAQPTIGDMMADAKPGCRQGISCARHDYDPRPFL